MFNLIRNNPRTFHTAIAVAAIIAALVTTTDSCRAASFKTETNKISQQELYICADTQWGIRDLQGSLVGNLAPGECMKVVSFEPGSMHVTVEGGKSGKLRILRLDLKTQEQLLRLWNCCP